MKKLFIYITYITATLAIAVSCSKESVLTTGNDNITFTFSASFENPITRVTADANSTAVDYSWENGDEIKVLYDGGSTTAQATVKGSSATFSPSLPSGTTTVWMVFPSTLGASLDGGRLKIDMPEAQKEAIPAFFVASGSTSEGTFTFRHPLAWYKFVVGGDGSDITRLNISSAEGKNLTSSALTLDFDASGVPSVNSLESAASSVNLDFTGVGTYYLPIVPDVSKEASDLTFQFYRGEARNEKAGAYRHSKALADSRSSLMNWGNLPTMATNRYVSTSGSSSNTGVTSDKAWDLATFKEFMENSSSRNDETLALYDGVNFRLAAGTYSLSAKIVPNIPIKTNIIGHSSDDTFIDGGSDRLLFDIYKKSGEAVTFRNITFQNGSNSNDGGAFRIGNGSREFTIVFEDCKFIKNSVATAGKFGGAFYMCANSEVSFKNCSFGDGTEAGRNYAQAGGAIYATGNAKVNLTDCVFNYNQATGSAGDGGGSCIFANSTNIIKINRCEFTNNTAGSRGVIRVNNNVLVYMNGVSFYGNTTTEASNPWGLNIHGGNSFICMNNVTSYGNSNTQSVTSNSCAFNCDRGFIITNSTLIDHGGQYEIRINDINSSGYQKIHNLAMCNNIISNESKPDDTFWVRGSITLNNYGHNLRGATVVKGNVLDSNPATDKFGQTDSVLGGTYSDGVYSWSGSVAGFTPATASDVENAIKACTVTMAGETAGTGFYAWLQEIDAIGKDARGVTRSTPWWPGAYQN